MLAEHTKKTPLWGRSKTTTPCKKESNWGVTKVTQQIRGIGRERVVNKSSFKSSDVRDTYILGQQWSV